MEHWERLTVGQVKEKIAASDSATPNRSGAGRERHPDNNVFKISHMSFSECFLSVVSDAVLPLILVTAAVAAFLGRHWQSLAIFAVICISCLFATLIKRISRSKCERMGSHMLPTAHIMSYRGVKNIKCTYLSVGDIIILSAGDIVPADARLISSDQLSVLEYFTEPGTTAKTVRREHKDADRVYGENEECETYENLIYAGSAVSTGHCRAVVIAIGDNTRASMLYSGINLLPVRDMPREYYSLKKKVRPIGIAMLIAVIPITIIGLLTSGRADMSLLDIFTLALAVAVGTLSEQTLSSAEFIISSELSETSAEGSVLSAPTVSQPSAAEKLAAADTVTIFSDSVLCDTSIEVRAAYRAGKTYFAANTQSGDLLPLAELVAVSQLSRDGLPTSSAKTSRGEAVSRYTAEMNISRMGVMSGIKSLTTRNDTPIPGVVSTVIEHEYESDAVGTHREIICVSDRQDLITNCRKYRADDGSLQKLTPADRDAFTNACREFIDTSLDIIIYATSQSAASGLVLEGVIGVGPAFPECNVQAVEEAKAEGLDVILIIEGESVKERAYARCCGLAAGDGEIAFASDFASDGRSICDGIGRYRIYCGFGAEGALQLLGELEQRGRRIIRVVERSGQLRSSPADQIVCAVNQTSDSTVCVCSEFFIDKSVATNDADESGFYGITDAVRRSRVCLKKLKILKYYLMFASAMRVSAVLLPLFMYKSDIIPPVICVLICGLFLDLFAILIISGYQVPSHKPIDMSETGEEALRKGGEASQRKLLTSLIYTLCGIMAGGMIMLVSVSAASLLPSDSAGIPFLTFLSILTTWCVGLFSVSCSVIGSPFKRRVNPAMILTLLALALIGAGCSAVPLLGMLGIMGAWSPFLPALALLPALASYVLLAAFTAITKHIPKSRG